MWDEYEKFITNKRAYRGHSLMVCIIRIPILAVTIWLWLRLSTGTGCETFINIPLLVIGALILLFSISGSCVNKPLSRSCCTRETIMFFLLVALLGCGIFVLTISSPGGGRRVPGRAHQEYFLDEYSSWLQHRVNSSYHWDHHLKTCLVKKQVCHKFFNDNVKDSQDKFFARHLSSIESGCCKPPTDCNFSYKSPTQWTKPKDGNHSNMDCDAWDNGPNVLCLDCQSCKAGFANDVKISWIIAGVVIIVVFSLIAFICPCASCEGGIYTICRVATLARRINPEKLISSLA